MEGEGEGEGDSRSEGGRGEKRKREGMWAFTMLFLKNGSWERKEGGESFVCIAQPINCNMFLFFALFGSLNWWGV